MWPEEGGGGGAEGRCSDAGLPSCRDSDPLASSAHVRRRLSTLSISISLCKHRRNNTRRRKRSRLAEMTVQSNRLLLVSMYCNSAAATR